jgi:Cell division protein FtsA.
MPLVAGIDCGTGFTKALLVAQDLAGEVRIVGKGKSRSGINVDEAATNALSEALDNAGANRADVG